MLKQALHILDKFQFRDTSTWDGMKLLNVAQEVGSHSIVIVVLLRLHYKRNPVFA